MSAEERLTQTPSGIVLSPLDEIADGKARSFVIQMRAGRFHGFAVRVGRQVHGYVDRCPHMGLPLAHKLDEYLTPKDDFVVCAWHAAIFEIASGKCVGGPCSGQALISWPLAVAGGDIVTA